LVDGYDPAIRIAVDVGSLRKARHLENPAAIDIAFRPLSCSASRRV